jgi:TetR/AcrR family transcriptional regulator, mexJK operon transcriptional repressor
MTIQRRTKVTSAPTASAAPVAENRKVRAIIAAADKLFLQQGLTAPSMDLIADTAGVSKATIYVYFRSRDKLLLALIEHHIRSNGPGMIWDPATNLLDAEEELRGIAKRLMDFYHALQYRDRAVFRLIEEQAKDLPEIGRTAFAAGPQKTNAEVAFFLRVANKKELLCVPDVDLAAMQFISLIYGDLQIRRVLSVLPFPTKKALDARIEAGIRVFLAAYGPASSRRHRR